jgi:hypothetical protein
VVDPLQESVPPRAMANVAPLDIGGVAGQTRLIVEAVKDTVADLKADIHDIKGHRVSDLRWHIGIFGAGFLVLAGMLITGYFKLEDRVSALSTASTRVETKLDDLLARIPPVQTPVPSKR